MKLRIFFYLGLSLFFAGAISSQTTEGAIVYEVKVNLHTLLPGDMEAMKASIPEFQTVKKELLFNREASVFRDYEEEPGSGGRGGWFRMGASEIQHQDLSNAIYTVQRNILNEEYLIEQDVKRYPWNLTGRTEMIAGKICQLAWRMDERDSTMIELWFTPEIPVSVGPDNYFGLPGAVLMAVINYNERIYIATEIREESVPPSRTAPPNRGTRVSPEEFEEISEEMMEQFRSRMGGGRRR